MLVVDNKNKLGGYVLCDSPDAGLLVSLLPTLVHVRGIERLSTLMRLVGEEANEQRSGCDIVLSRLVEGAAGGSVAHDADGRRPCGAAAWVE